MLAELEHGVKDVRGGETRPHHAGPTALTTTEAGVFTRSPIRVILRGLT
jgi:hypothetical protein